MFLFPISIKSLSFFILLLGLGAVACAQGAGPLYRQADAPVAARVQDLLDRMTLAEKVAQLRQLQTGEIFSGQQLDRAKLRQVVGSTSYGFTEGLTLKGKSSMRAMYRLQHYMVDSTRLGIPVLTISESLHGSVGDGSTIFPQSVALGSTFNPALAYAMTAMISRELKAQGIRQTMSPGMDVVRDLRWGRVEEAFGEDPYLVGRMSIAEVRGYLDHGISAMLKPFGPDGAPTGGLNLASVACGEREARDIYLKPYQMAIDSTNVSALMTSYSSWNGVPNSSSRFLLTDILRNEWGFKGYVYSDWGAIEMLQTFHHTATDDSDAALQALRAGVDVEAASHCYTTLPALVEQGVLDEKLIDTAVARVLRTKFLLGLFEHPFGDTTNYDQQVHRPEAVALSRRIADESIVLLKNQQQLLPLASHADALKSLAVIGPNADQVQFGDYTWSRSNADGVTPLAGIKALLKGSGIPIHYAKGCDLTTADSSGFAEAIAAAKASELSILFMGSASASLARDYSNATSGEGFDLADLRLTGLQEQLIHRIYALGKPVVLVLVTGKPFALPWEKAHLPAIVVQWYGGERAGDAIAAMLFGKTNPSGKLPFSFPRSVGHLPVYYNHLPTDKGFYHHPGQPGKPGRDYVFSSPEALWSFGHGRSYTTFTFIRATVADTLLTARDTIQVRVQLTNTGHRAGKEVVQLYMRDVVSSVVTPVQQLKAFQKVFLRPEDTVTTLLKVPVQELALYNLQMDRVVEPGTFELQIGSASDSIAFTKIVTVVPSGGAAAAREQASRRAKQRQEAPSKAGAMPRGNRNKGIAKDGGMKTKDRGEQKALSEGKLIMVSGEVRDVQATPVTGVQIRAMGSQERTRTDDRGRYKIKAYSTDTLIFSASGYQEKKQAVSGSATLNVRLQYRQQ